MRNLLCAYFARLWRDKVFWTGMLCMAGCGLYCVCTGHSDIVRRGSGAQPLDRMLFLYTELIGCFSATFCSLFFGTEYRDGALRNKLIVGHTRGAIYLSGWLISVAQALLTALAYLVPYGALGVFLLDAPNAPPGKLAVYLCISLFLIVAFASLFYLLALLIDKRSTAAVACILTFIGLVVVALTIKERLDAPEFSSAYMMIIDGVEQLDPIPNPRYLQPEQRWIYQLFLDLLPSGQMVQVASFTVLQPAWLMGYAVLVSAVSTGLGLFFFRKKDLK